MTQNATAHTQVWAHVDHPEVAGKSADTWWTPSKIAESAKPTHGKFLIGPANEDFSILFINNGAGATLSSLNAKTTLISIDYTDPAEFLKLCAMGKGGALAAVFIVLCIVFCCVGVLVWKFLGAIKRCICGSDEDAQDDDFNRHKE